MTLHTTAKLVVSLVAVVGCDVRSGPPSLFGVSTWKAGDLYPSPREIGEWPMVDRAVTVSYFNLGRTTDRYDGWMLNDGRTGSDWAIIDGDRGHPCRAPPDPLPANASMPLQKRVALDEIIRDLPPSQTPDSDGNVVVVSWATAGGWITRTYDRTHLPGPVLRLRELLKIPTTWIGIVDPPDVIR